MTDTRTADADAFVDVVRATLESLADPVRAAGQRAYMKSQLPYLGIASPDLKRALREPLAAHRLPDAPTWEFVIRRLWDEVTHREQWYAALAVARHRYYRAWRLDPGSLALCEHLIRTGAWWDVCDEIARHLVSPMIGAHPGLADEIRRWAHDDHLWVRRVAVQSQLTLRKSTDLELLTEVIDANSDDSTFWMRKAVGWALREQSKCRPEWVREFVADRPQLSGLSRREALRLIQKSQ